MSTDEILQDVLLLVTNLSAMGAAGLATRGEDLRRLLGSPGLVARTVAVNVVGLPLLAGVATWALGVPAPIALGILLAASAPGGGTGVLLTRLAGGDVALSVAMVLLFVVTGAVTAPLAVHLLGGDPEPGLLGRMALDAARFQLLPLLAGGLTRWARPALAARLEPALGRIGTISLLVLVLGLLVTRGAQVVLVGAGGLAAISVCVAATAMSGPLAGVREPQLRTAFALSTTVRNLSLALLLSGFTLRQPPTTLAILAYGLVMYAGALVIAARATSPRS
jgi:BASS family bile acid:Na+ symporter